MHASAWSRGALGRQPPRASRNERERARGDAAVARATLLRWGRGAPGSCSAATSTSATRAPTRGFAHAGGHRRRPRARPRAWRPSRPRGSLERGDAERPAPVLVPTYGSAHEAHRAPCSWPPSRSSPPAVAGTRSSRRRRPPTPRRAISSGDGTSIAMKNIAFAPKETTVKVGRRSPGPTRRTSSTTSSPPRARSSSRRSSARTARTRTRPEQAGKIEYTCTLHPGMDGELTVTG